jgi:mannose-6-phosphate isomerase-like protein (cupin superfamily)
MKKIKKPWGREKELVLNKKCTVKILEVAPHQMFSLQYHKKRTEEWYFLTDGIAQIGLKKKKYKKGDLIKIKAGTAHRLIAGKKKVQVLEISHGKWIKKDIVRMEDKYGRE